MLSLNRLTNDTLWRPGLCCLIFVCCTYFSFECAGQDIEPRRWTPLPAGTKVLGIGGGNTSGDVYFDPVLLTEDVVVDAQSIAVSYVHSLKIGGKLSRIDVLLPMQSITWEGLLDGEQARVDRSGLVDPRLRLSMVLLNRSNGDSPERGDRTTIAKTRTVVGGAVAVTLPLGEYYEEKLINLGQNRFVVRPQVGIVHTRGAWSYELTGSVFFFSDNDDFYPDQTREQDPLFAMQAHVIRVFKPGMWMSLSTGYGWGGESMVSGVAKDDERGNFLSAFTLGLPLSKRQGVKFSYVWARTQEGVGGDTDSILAAWSCRL